MGDNQIFIKEVELKNEISYKNIHILKYSIKYPRFTSFIYESFIDRLNWYYRHQAYLLAEYCEGELRREAAQLYNESVVNGFPFHEYEFMSVYNVSYNADFVLSLYFDQSQYTGGANGITYRNSKSWNVKTGAEIELSELFPTKNHLKDYIVMKVNEEISQQIEQVSTSNYFDDYKNLVVKYYDPKNFYMSRFTASIYFQEITVAPHSSGIPVFDILYDENQIIGQESDEINPYKVRSELLMDATDDVGVFTSKDAVNVWAHGLAHRSGAMQYIVMTKKLKKSYANVLDNNNKNWVTGVSSPWVNDYSIVKCQDLEDGSASIEMKIDTETSAGFWKSYYAKLTVVKEEGFWRVGHIQADRELYLYMGDYSGTDFI